MTIVLALLLDEKIALQRVCGGSVVNHLIRSLEQLNIEKVLITDINDAIDTPLRRLKINSSSFTIASLKEIKQQMPEVQTVILLPANLIYINLQVIRNLLDGINHCDLVVAEHSTNKALIAANIDAFSDYDNHLKITDSRIKRANIIVANSDIRLINNLHDIIAAEQEMQNKLRAAAIDNGVLLVDPHTTYLSFDMKIDPGVTIYPNVVIGPNVIIEKHVSILSFSQIEATHIHSNCVIGPFARLRDTTIIANNSHIGNFVEVKNSIIAEEVKIKHLSYIGDSTIGKYTNIGAGTITCNYNGIKKHRTIIDEKCFIGANCSLIAPIYIARNVTIGAGSVIAEDITENNIAIARVTPTIKNKK